MFTQNGLLSSHLINSILKSLISVGVFKDNFRKFPLLISGHISSEMIEFYLDILYAGSTERTIRK